MTERLVMMRCLAAAKFDLIFQPLLIAYSQLM
jgi:hypothetical protein